MCCESASATAAARIIASACEYRKALPKESTGRGAALMYNRAPMLLYRRHLKTCRHRKKSQNFASCQCAIWIDGLLNGKRYRRALETCDWEKAERKKAGLESVGEDSSQKTLQDAVTAWDRHLVGQKLRESTLRKYRR